MHWTHDDTTNKLMKLHRARWSRNNGKQPATRFNVFFLHTIYYVHTITIKETLLTYYKLLNHAAKGMDQLRLRTLR